MKSTELATCNSNGISRIYIIIINYVHFSDYAAGEFAYITSENDFYRIAGFFRGIQFSQKSSLQRFHNLIFKDANIYIPRSDRTQSSAGKLRCIARRLKAV